ncbi:hypothetical protein CmeUKMEL1_01600 [Cryptosporidium meleagridis]|uniref:Integral membrane protein n=1 Tax=Cryptosporidium meleagridis TaxID=93969 RepID=A0A2P4YWU3_9CRYT|nr:hypothetical protein CmeUKMEL1_01600 [Cryptosporidium meleagridis]
MKIFYLTKTLFLILILGVFVKSENFRSAQELEENTSNFEENSQNSSKNFVSNAISDYYNHVSNAVTSKLSEEAQKIKSRFKDVVQSAGDSIKNFITEKKLGNFGHFVSFEITKDVNTSKPLKYRLKTSKFLWIS